MKASKIELVGHAPHNNIPNIEWSPPKPRSGFLGEWDKFVGPGATSAEAWLQLGGGIFLTGIVGVLLYLRRDSLNWSSLQATVAILLALDIIGGIITNATSAAKRWYHRPGHNQLSFIALHGLHLLVISVLFRRSDWLFFAGTYGYLLLAALLIMAAPLYLQRPLSFILYCGGFLLGTYIFSPTPGLEWLLPFFYLKLLISHLVKEAPFVPTTSRQLATHENP